MINDVRAWHRVNYACNPQIKIDLDIWKAANPEKVQEYNKRSYLKKKSDPQRMVKRKEASKRWRAKNMPRIYFLNHQRARQVRGLPGKHTYDQWLALKEVYNNTCPCCGRSEPEIILTEDHVIPISVEGSTNNIDNIQPLCGECNARKYNKIIRFALHQVPCQAQRLTT